jgi:outer membrane protein assembly factor BamB
VLALAAGGRSAPDRPSSAPWWLPPVVERLTPAEGLGAATAGWGDAWMDDRWRQSLLRLDGTSGRVVARLRVDGRVALSAGGGALWALQSGGGYGRELRGPLLRIDPIANRVAARIPLRTSTGEPVVGFGVLAADGDVWVWGPLAVLRIDPRANRAVQAFAVAPTGRELTGAALADRQLVATTTDGRLMRFDRRTGVTVAPGAVAGTDLELRAATDRRLLLASHGSLLAVDSGTGSMLWRRRLGFRIGEMLGHGRVLLAHGSALGDAGDRLWAIDAATGRVLHSVVLPAFGTRDMVAVNGALWVACAGGTVIVIPKWLLRRLQAE